LGLPYLRIVVVGESGVIDPYGYWRGIREIDEAGAILVRPDGYVAWRQSAAVWEENEAQRQLDAALSALLDRPVGVHLDRPDAREDYSIEPVPITVPQAEPTTSAPVRSGADL